MAFHRFCRLWTRLAVIGILLIMGGLASANPMPSPPDSYRRRPEPPPQPPAVVKHVGQPASFVVRRDAAQEQSRIVIPRKFLPQGVVAPNEDPFGDNSTPNSSLVGSRHKAVDAGLLLTTVIAGGGLTVVFVRRRKVGTAVGILVGTLLLTAALGTAMAVEPPAPAADGGNLLDQAKIAKVSAQATVEIVETGDEITLILGKDAPQPGP